MKGRIGFFFFPMKVESFNGFPATIVLKEDPGTLLRNPPRVNIYSLGRVRRREKEFYAMRISRNARLH
jgi:hypothetical protein